jgi:hypothetical protein
MWDATEMAMVAVEKLSAPQLQGQDLQLDFKFGMQRAEKKGIDSCH